MLAWGIGVTTCGFCATPVTFRLCADHVHIAGRTGRFDVNMPLFCAPECETAASLRLDELVNA